MTKTRLRLLLLLPLVLAACSYAAWRATRTGYEFPPASKIARMEAKTFRGAVENAFTVPGDEYEEILSALSPSSYDGNPSKWQVMGELTIYNVDESVFQVFLFDLGDARVGAFAAGANWDSRTYYRGGTSDRLSRALEKAYAKSATH